MKVMTDIRQTEWERAAVSIGKFEGLHAGHHKLIQKLTAAAGQKGIASVVFTFDVSPRRFFGYGAGQLFTAKERRSVLESWDLQYLIEYPFTRSFAGMEPEQFIEEILMEKLHMGYLVVGENFRFGKERAGDVELLRRYAAEGAFELEVIGREFVSGEPVSSTQVRRELAKGNMERVERMLDFPFFVDGEVVEGNHLGRTWGIPTANLTPSLDKLLPPNGVYFSRVWLEGRMYYGITNIGSKPTVGGCDTTGIETYLYNYDGNLYGRNIRVELITYQRPEQRFDSKDALIERLRYDVSCGEAYFRSRTGK